MFKRMEIPALVPGSDNHISYRVCNDKGEVILYQPSTVTGESADMIALSKEDIIAVHALLGRMMSEF